METDSMTSCQSFERGNFCMGEPPNSTNDYQGSIIVLEGHAMLVKQSQHPQGHSTGTRSGKRWACLGLNFGSFSQNLGSAFCFSLCLGLSWS